MTASVDSMFALRAVDLMSRDLVLIPREMSLQGAARMLARATVSGAPVVDEQGRCVGVLSTTDFMHSYEKNQNTDGSRSSVDCMCSAWQIPEHAPREVCSVENFMTKDPVLVRPRTTIGELARMMMDAHIHRVIVVDGPAQKPVGIVSSLDILAAVARASQGAVPGSSEDQGVMAESFS